MTSTVWGQPEAEWTSLKRSVQQRLGKLESLMQDAETRGICTDYASVSRHVIATYLVAAQHDRDHVEEVREIFQQVWWIKKTDPKEADVLPWNELRACIDVADHAIAELETQLSGKITLASPPDFSKGTVTLDSAYYRLDGKPVFPHSLVWLPADPDYMHALGHIGGIFYQLTNLRSDESVAVRTLEGLAKRTETDVSQNAAPLVHLLGHAPAKWMTQTHPEISQGKRNFTKYDIDNPLVRDWLNRLCEAVLPVVAQAAGGQPQVHLLANEPHFATKKRGWLAANGVSEITMQKYRQWLAAKYSNVDTLNRSHGKSYAAFSEVTIEMPIDPTLRGTAVWYDWCRFNMDRVNDWFAFLKETTQRHDPERSPVSIKTLGHTLCSSDRDGGMDIEFLTRLQDIPGSDLRVVPQGATFYGKNEDGRDTETGWASRYAYLWVDQSMVLDFTKSLCPNRPFYDSEWHGFGTVSWRHYRLNRQYVRSAMWLAFSHGMGLINPWLWGRKMDGSLSDKADHIGELATQPIAVDAYGRVMKELNAHAEDVVAAVPSRRDILIFYCEDSAIQDAQYMEHVTEIYEALKLTNRKIGFVTVTDLDSVAEASRVIVIPPTVFISDDSFAILKKLRNGGAHMVVFEGERCFRKNELGAQRSDVGELTVDADMRVAPVLEMTEEFERTLPPAAAMPLEITVTNERGEKAYGVFVSQSVHPQTGVVSIVLNNVGNSLRRVRLRPVANKSGMMIDMIEKRRVGGTIEMKPCDVRLLKAKLQ
ncbi:beta-galactosidase [Rhodopirellula sallentina]|uniref:beta-galactosidase n=1 Tax=Rhodopirellula sallentina TaxID=1263869 RepID=UPI000A2EE547|nr:beta-galactosidase [Rhodopirellula sallentina]